MSVFYNVREHIEIRNHNSCRELAQAMLRHMAALDMAADENGARFHLVKIMADGAEYSLAADAGKLQLDEEYAEQVVSLMSADSFSVTLHYSYTGSLSPEAACSEPTYAVDYAKKCGSEAKNDFFYSLFLGADCSETAGSLQAYGTRSGKEYSGHILPVTVNALPCGSWCTDSSSVYYEADLTGEEDVRQIERVCNDLLKLTSTTDACEVKLVSLNGTKTIPNPSIEEDRITFALDYLLLTCDEDCRKYVRLCAELNELTDGECSFNGYLHDDSCELGRIAEIDFDFDGSYIVRLTEI